jgi:hypothetical protein
MFCRFMALGHPERFYFHLRTRTVAQSSSGSTPQTALSRTNLFNRPKLSFVGVRIFLIDKEEQIQRIVGLGPCGLNYLLSCYWSALNAVQMECFCRLSYSQIDNSLTFGLVIPKSADQIQSKAETLSQTCRNVCRFKMNA